MFVADCPGAEAPLLPNGCREWGWLSSVSEGAAPRGPGKGPSLLDKPSVKQGTLLRLPGSGHKGGSDPHLFRPQPRQHRLTPHIVLPGFHGPWGQAGARLAGDPEGVGIPARKKSPQKACSWRFTHHAISPEIPRNNSDRQGGRMCRRRAWGWAHPSQSGTLGGGGGRKTLHIEPRDLLRPHSLYEPGAEARSGW